jgi:hypothetical protein
VNQLVPCPDCNRHVRKSEQVCPFCGAAVALAALAAPPLPSRRLGRAATFAFGATLVGATSIVGCSDENDPRPAMPVYGAPPSAGAGNEPLPPAGDGGASPVGGDGGVSSGGMTTIYGGPPGGGAGGQVPEIGGSGPDNRAGDGGAFTVIYGGPPGGGGSED